MILPVLLIFSLGVAVIFTSNPGLALEQLLFGIIGLIAFLFLRVFDFRALKFLIKPAYLIVLVLLVITLILGLETRGSVRWIPLGIFNFQPSEFAKPVLILALAYFWSKNRPNWLNIGKSFLIVLPILGLIFEQPDLGTTLTVFFIYSCLLWASNISLKKVTLLLSIVLLLIPPTYFFLHDYQKQRIASFLSPTQDPQGIGFHVIQSMIAVGSGEFFGRGLGRGTQSRLQFLPEFRTDFIFAFIAEELGFVGALSIIIFYGLIFYFLYRIISRTSDRFGELVTIGVFGMIFFQVFVNIGMNIGLLPITGITLPLLSYGGSSVITTFISLGIASSVSRYTLRKKDPQTVSIL